MDKLAKDSVQGEYCEIKVQLQMGENEINGFLMSHPVGEY